MVFSFVYFTLDKVYKNGSIHSIENYRPVAALCSGSKIFEMLILKRIAALELLHDVELVGSQQHGFSSINVVRAGTLG